MNSTEHQNIAAEEKSFDDGIMIRKLFSILWSNKWWLILITFLFGVASVISVLQMPNMYTSKITLSESKGKEGGGVSSLVSHYQGLSSLVGMNLFNGDANDKDIAIAIVNSDVFLLNFFQKYNLAPGIFAAKTWSSNSGKLNYNTEIYDETTNKLTYERWQLVKKFKDNFGIEVNKENGLITVKYEHVSPDFSAKVISSIVAEINETMRLRSLAKTNQKIEYLKEQISKTSVSEIRNIFNSLIEEQLKNKMLADVDNEFIFSVVNEATIPERKSSPKRAIICIAVTFLGFVLAVLFVLSKVFINTYFKESKELE